MKKLLAVMLLSAGCGNPSASSVSQPMRLFIGMPVTQLNGYVAESLSGSALSIDSISSMTVDWPHVLEVQLNGYIISVLSGMRRGRFTAANGFVSSLAHGPDANAVSMLSFNISIDPISLSEALSSADEIYRSFREARLSSHPTDPFASITDQNGTGASELPDFAAIRQAFQDGEAGVSSIALCRLEDAGHIFGLEVQRIENPALGHAARFRLTGLLDQNIPPASARP